MEGNSKEKNLAGENETMVHSNDLFGKNRLVTICHRGTFYRLMITKQGKLILTK